AQTGDIDEYKDYITQTQKMRAYRGKIEATSPLAKMAEKEAEPAAPAPAPAPKPQPAPERKIALRVAAQPGAEGASMPGNSSNLIMISAILVLVLAAIGLLVALVIR
ncbi:MAG TPA: hypothetical protein VHP62_13460, partial [Usitatibacter sp.]|nr:hypothetical protein [Usitatibacter sp.]